MAHWKLLGLAGLAGVAATGAVVVRAQRHRQALTADEVRSRLQQRLAEVSRPDDGPVPGGQST